MEPIFRTNHKNDPEIEKAHALCADRIDQFVELVKKAEEPIYMAKLRFRDPDKSEERDDFLFYLWLSEVVYHKHENMLSGVFFEVPEGFEKWHHVGKRLGFDPEDVFDWMVIDSNENMMGGFTIRVTRSRLETEEEKNKYDKYIGVRNYQSLFWRINADADGCD
ncbi:MAG: DUF2314 domain-containing protein [Candidatus Kapaibacteriota bacterium]